MNKAIIAIAAVSGLLASANAELILNGDLEADGYKNSGLNNVVTNVANWAGTTKISTTDKVIEQPNTVFRMQGGASVNQEFSTDWGADDTFTISLNACEVYWRPTVASGIWASLRPAGGGVEYDAHLFDTSPTHTGVYTEWTDAMTFSHDVTGADLIAAGATAGDSLRLNLYSKDINWLDNISVTVIPEPATLGLVAVFGGGVLFIRRRFMI